MTEYKNIIIVETNEAGQPTNLRRLEDGDTISNERLNADIRNAGSNATTALNTANTALSQSEDVSSTVFTYSGTWGAGGIDPTTLANLVDTSNAFANFEDNVSGTFASSNKGTGVIVDADIATDAALSGGKLLANSVTNTQLKAGAAVANIGTGGITANELGTNAVETVKINPSAVTAGKINQNAITADKIVAGTITNTQLAGGVALANIGTEGITATELGPSAVTAAKINENAITGDKIVAGTISGTQIAAGAINGDKLASLSVNTGNLINNAVETIKIDGLAVTEAKLAASAVTADKIDVGAVTEVKIGTGAVTTTKLGASSVTNNKIADNAVNTEEIADGAVDSNKIKDLNVLEGKIGTGAVTEDKLGSSAVTANKIDVGAVTEVKIGDGAVTTDKIANNSVTADKLDHVFTNTPGQFTNATVTVDAQGRVTAAATGTGGGGAGGFAGSATASALTIGNTSSVPFSGTDGAALDLPTNGMVPVLDTGAARIKYQKLRGISIADGEIDADQLADGAVNDNKLGNSLDLNSHVQANNIGFGKLTLIQKQTLVGNNASLNGPMDDLSKTDAKGILGITAGTTAPSTFVSAGDLWYNTDDDELYTYDSGRGHWLGAPYYISMGKANAATAAGVGHFLYVGHQGTAATTQERGWLVPHDMVITGWRGHTKSTFTGWVARVDKNSGGTNTNGVVTTGTLGAVDTFSDFTLDVDLAAGDIIGVSLTTGTVTIDNSTVTIKVQRKGA